MHPFYKTYISIKWLGEWAVYHSRGISFSKVDHDIAKVAIYGSKDLGSRIEIYDLSSCSTCTRLGTDGGLWH